MTNLYNVGDRVVIGKERGDFPLKDNQLTGTVVEAITNEEGMTGYEVALDNMSKEEARKLIPPLFVALMGLDGSSLLFHEHEIAGKEGEVAVDTSQPFVEKGREAIETNREVSTVQVGDRVRIVGGGYTLRDDQLTGTVESINGNHRGPIELVVDNYPHDLVAKLFGDEDNQHLLSFKEDEIVKLELS